jgi:hypothetical protein
MTDRVAFGAHVAALERKVRVFGYVLCDLFAACRLMNERFRCTIGACQAKRQHRVVPVQTGSAS